MAYASQTGRASTNASSPRAHAICDRCGCRYNHQDLQWAYDWRGAALQNIRLLVCRPCLDVPQEQLRAIIVPADPTPIINARVEAFLQDESNYRAVSLPLVTDPATGIPIPSTTLLLAEDGQNLSTQGVGPPLGLEQGAVMPLKGTVHYGVHLPVVSIMANGTTIVTVTCSAPHGLVTNGQISAEGLSNAQADGFYSVTVTTATAFTYQTNKVIPVGSLLTSTANIITVLVGLPLGYTQVPQTGI